MTYQLVLQWTTELEDGYDELIAMETSLEGAIPAAVGDVDGHDLGSGEMNLFVDTDDPQGAFRAASSALGGNPRWAAVRAGYGAVDGDDYTVLWPPALEQFRVA